MILKAEFVEAKAIAGRLMPTLMLFPMVGVEEGAALRTAVGKFMVRFSDYLYAQQLGTMLFDCFEKARAAGATLNSMDRVRKAMFDEEPLHALGMALVNAAIIFSFVEQTQIITVTEFRSRLEAGEVMDAMGLVIEDIKLNKADTFVSGDYQNFVRLAATLVQHLSATERLLPRIVQYQMPVHYPALALSNRIYGEGSRSDELIAENKTVHPAFMQRNIIALSF
jgi:prophage DNA circulation protein